MSDERQPSWPVPTAAVSEAWVDGHVHAFAFFGRVPQSVVYDNDRCLVAKILPGGSRKRTKLFSGFLSHYFIQYRYGRPGKGNDKGAVEGLVGYARRNFMVPMPQFPTWEAFNFWLEEQCRKRQDGVLRGHSDSIGQRLTRDLDAMMELPAASGPGGAREFANVFQRILGRSMSANAAECTRVRANAVFRCRC